MRYFFCAISFLIIGYFIGRGTETQKIIEIESDPEVIVKEKKVIEKEYIQTDLEEAKLYYGKAFLLFLANLGLKITESQKDDLEQLLEDPQAYSPKTQSKENDYQLPREISFKANEEFKSFLQKERAELRNISDEKILRDTQDFILKQPSIFYAKSKFITDYTQIKKLNGNYQASLFRLVGNKKGSVDEVTLSIDFLLKRENQIEGSFNMKMSREGHIYSDSNGNGGNNDVRIIDGQIIIEAGPGWFFHFLDDRMHVANYYENGKFIGVARFQRQ